MLSPVPFLLFLMLASSPTSCPVSLNCTYYTYHQPYQGVLTRQGDPDVSWGILVLVIKQSLSPSQRKDFPQRGYPHPTPLQNSAPPAGVSENISKKRRVGGCVWLGCQNGEMRLRLKMEICTHFTWVSNHLRRTPVPISSPSWPIWCNSGTPHTAYQRFPNPTDNQNTYLLVNF